jgi:hypothetical protein
VRRNRILFASRAKMGEPLKNVKKCRGDVSWRSIREGFRGSKTS